MLNKNLVKNNKSYNENTELNLFRKYDKTEDNITQGFLGILKSIRESSAKIILHRLFKDVPLKLKNGLVYDVQTPSAHNEKIFHQAGKGYIIGISSIDTRIRDDVSKKKQSRADGWICDKENLLLIESKIVPEFSGDQFKREKVLLEKYTTKISKPYTITWQLIDKVFKDLTKTENFDFVEQNLISDYRRYIQMEGLTLDFEKFFNSTSETIEKNWITDAPKTTLRLLKNKILSNIGDIKESRERLNEYKMNFYWLRLFQKKIGLINWRGSLYLNPDEVAIDVLAFKPNKHTIDNIIEQIIHLGETFEKLDQNRIWIYFTNYGKRRKVQSGRDYEYSAFNYNIGRAQITAKDFKNLISAAKVIFPKQIGIKLAISNPGSKSTAYWSGNGSDINSQDAMLLQNPDKVVEKFCEFIKKSNSVIRLK